MKKTHIALPGLLLSTLLASASVLAGSDARGCKDHPLFTRMSNYSIFECKSRYDQFTVKFENDPNSAKNLKLEGELTSLAYGYDSTRPDAAASKPSELQVFRNYQNAAKEKGGEVMIDRPGYTAMKFDKGGNTVYAVVRGYNGTGGRVYLDIMEVKAMTQEVTANLMWDTLKKDGFIALQINFDTNKAVIKPESMPIVKQIADLLKNQPTLKISVEGHTDNQGNPGANKTLSLERAKAVVAAVAAGGIKAERMAYAGWGQERPVADNRTEDGRAKNRRVELVKQ